MTDETLTELLGKLEPVAKYRIGDASRLIPCHRNTLLKYEKIGAIQPARDAAGHRRYTAAEVVLMKALLNRRMPASHGDGIAERNNRGAGENCNGDF